MTALKRDLSDLPRSEGWQPDPEPRFGQVLVEAWAAAYEKREAERTPSGKGFKHSDAGKCARAISYRAAGIPPSNPMDLTGTHNVNLGTLIHDAWQAAIAEVYPDACQIELQVETDGVDSIGFIDAVVTMGDGKVVSIELKSQGGWGFKNSIGKARKNSPAEGPKTDHMLQAALNAAAVDADEAVVLYIAKECLSATQYREVPELSRFIAEWTMDRETYEALAAKEAERVAGILEVVDGGHLAARKIPYETPPGAEITDPLSGSWVQTAEDGEVIGTGSFWGCNYCDWQTTCALTQPGRIPIDSVKRKGKAA